MANGSLHLKQWIHQQKSLVMELNGNSEMTKITTTNNLERHSISRNMIKKINFTVTLQDTLKVQKSLSKSAILLAAIKQTQHMEKVYLKLQTFQWIKLKKLLNKEIGNK